MSDIIACGWRCDGDGRSCALSEGGVLSSRVVLNAPLLDEGFGFAETVEDLASEQRVLNFALKHPQWPFSQGDPGTMLRLFVSRPDSHRRSIFAAISRPLSDLMQFGMALNNILASTTGGCLDKVEAPDMFRMFGPNCVDSNRSCGCHVWSCVAECLEEIESSGNMCKLQIHQDQNSHLPSPE